MLQTTQTSPVTIVDVGGGHSFTFIVLVIPSLSDLHLLTDSQSVLHPMELWPCRASPHKFSHMIPWPSTGHYIQYLVYSIYPVILQHSRGFEDKPLTDPSPDWTPYPVSVHHSPPCRWDVHLPSDSPKSHCFILCLDWNTIISIDVW